MQQRTVRCRHKELKTGAGPRDKRFIWIYSVVAEDFHLKEDLIEPIVLRDILQARGVRFSSEFHPSVRCTCLGFVDF